MTDFDKSQKTPLENDKNSSVKKDQKKETPPKPKFNFYWIYAIIALVFFILYLKNPLHNTERTYWNELNTEMLKTGHIEKIVIVNDKEAYIYIKPDSLHLPKYKKLFSNNIKGIPPGPHYFMNIGINDNFEQRVYDSQQFIDENQRAKVIHEVDNKTMESIMSWVLMIGLLIILWIFIFKRMGPAGPGSQIFNIGKSRARLFDKESNIKIDFKEVAGLEEAKIEIKEIVEFLKNPTKYTALGGKIPKGVLLVGPPGTGKTLLAKAVAGEANVPFFSMSGSDFVEMFVGVGASRVRDLFMQAKSKSPCIVFIDEIDAIGRARGRNPNFGANDERESTLNQLLTEMDGFETNSGVIVLAATNRADMLDGALLRAGRFDRQIHVELPDLNERKAIFKVHMRPLKVDSTVDIDFLAKQTPGFSGADIANVCNESALFAARKNHTVIQRQDFLDAIDRIIGGLERKNKIITIEEKKTIAYHEAGHATVSWLLEYAHPLVKVTIIPRGKALGAAWYLPEERQITTKEQLLDELSALLGGRGSEEINFGKVSTGALNDLERVTKLAYSMVVYFGMSDKIGNISYYDSTGQNEMLFNRPYSEKTAEQIDEEVKKIITIAYERTKNILIKHKESLNKIAEKLLEKEVIFAEDLEKEFGKKRGQFAEEVKENKDTN